MSMRAGMTLGTVSRALEVLRLVGSADRPLRVTELAAAVGVHKSAVSRLCRVLREHGFLENDADTSGYVLGFRILELAGKVQERLKVRNAAIPIMTELTARTGEASFLNVLRGHACVCVEKVESPHPVRVTYEVGRHAPLTAGAPAKLLLAYAGEVLLEKVLAQGLQRYTPHTVTDPELFRKQLRQIREQGWAFSVAELTPDVAALAAPVWDGAGVVCAALCVSGPAYRFTPEVLPRWREEVVDAARRVSKALTARGGEGSSH